MRWLTGHAKKLVKMLRRFCSLIHILCLWWAAFCLWNHNMNSVLICDVCAEVKFGGNGNNPKKAVLNWMETHWNVPCDGIKCLHPPLSSSRQRLERAHFSWSRDRLHGSFWGVNCVIYSTEVRFLTLSFIWASPVEAPVLLKEQKEQPDWVFAIFGETLWPTFVLSDFWILWCCLSGCFCEIWANQEREEPSATSRPPRCWMKFKVWPLKKQNLCLNI